MQRQAQAAEKYSEYKKEERLLKAQLQALKYQQLDVQAKSKQVAIRDLELRMESFITDQVNKDTQIEKYRHSGSGVTSSILDKLRQMYSAKIAQEDILYKSQLRSTWDPDERTKLEEGHRRDVQRLHDELRVLLEPGQEAPQVRFGRGERHPSDLDRAVLP